MVEMRGTGFLAWDLAGGAKLIYPAFTPVRNRLMRGLPNLLPEDWLALIADCECDDDECECDI